jgi:hypothetical protein
MPKDELGRPVLVVKPLDDFEKKMSGLGRAQINAMVKSLLMANWALGAIIEEVVTEHGEDCTCMGCNWVEEHIGELGEPHGCSHGLGDECPFCDPLKLATQEEKRGDA